MAARYELGINFVYLLFLLLPGFVAVKAYLRANRRLDDLPRIDKVVFSVAGGLGSLAVLLILYRISPEFVQWALEQPWPTLESRPRFSHWFTDSTSVRVSTVERLPVLTLIIAIGVQTVLAAILGSLLGTLVSLFGRSPKQSKADLEQPWEAAFQSSKQGDRVTIITKGGMEIRGVIHRIGSPSENYDLLLRRSFEVVRVGNVVVDRRPLANVTYHHYEDVSQIHFHDSPGIEEFSPPGRFALILLNLLLSTHKFARGATTRWTIVKRRISGVFDRSNERRDKTGERMTEDTDRDSARKR